LETQYIKTYSPALGREMECKLYGHGGVPVLFIPCQDGRFFDFENFNMSETWAPWIESGQVMVLAIDTLDKETWSDTFAPAYDRVRRHESWINYIVAEVVPMLRDISRERNGGESPRVLTFGCSLGATHAATLFLRFPDLFGGCLALSGIYNAEYGFGNYMDEVVYLNSPVHFMENLPAEHPYIDKYNHSRGIICTGTGAWEQPETALRLRELFEQKGIDIWVDVWGPDVNHDWPWWHKMVPYFLPKLLEKE